ncbi:MAG: phosphatidate cytidylyltransferase [Acidimicrobiia bacterium]|nr:phosphatidate cytidylyltransferase [Acidimicrobiia bacterium]
MTSNQGGGTHPGDPWSPDWKPATSEETPEEDWPYDESLTLSDAELEIAELDDDEELEAESDVIEPEAQEPEAADTEAEAEEAAAAAEREAEEAAAKEAEAAAAAREAEEAAVKEAEEAAAKEAEAAAAEELAAREAEEAAAKEAEEAAAKEAAAREAEELAAREAEEAAAKEAEAVAAEELAAREAEEAAAKEAAEAEQLAAREAEEAAAREAKEAEEAAAREAKEAEEAAAREAEEAAAREAEEAAAKQAEELAAREAEEAAAKEAEELAAREAEEAAAREAEEAAAKEAEELAAREAEEAAAREAEELAAREAEEAAARAAEELAAREAEEAAAREAEELAAPETEDSADEVVLRAVGDTDADVIDAGVDEGIRAPIEEVELEDLQAEPEWLEAVEEMTLDDIADAGEGAVEDAGAMVSDEAAPSDEVETPTEVIESIVAGVGADDDLAEVVIEDATFEVVDLDDADLRADTAEHLFDVLDIEDAADETGSIAHDEITAEVDIDDLEAEPDFDTGAEPVEAEPPPLPAFEYEVPTEFEAVAADVDETRNALAAFMVPKAIADLSEGLFDEPGEDAEGGEPGEIAELDGVSEASDGQLQIPTGDDESLAMLEEGPFSPEEPGEPEEPEEALAEAEPEPAPVEDAPLRPEDELIAQLTGDLTMPDFETFVQEDFARDFVAEPTQEHVGLAETISTADAPEPSAVAATMPGVDHGHVGFEEFDEDLHFDDPDAVDVEEAVAGPDADGDESYGSDLTLRAASGVILVALLAATLWAGGVVFLLFIGAIALAAQIEFYAAVRKSGFRPMVLFGLLGGLGALIGTYVQGADAIRQAPVAIPAALGLTVVATFAWYGSQESPPADPWRNGLVTILGVAWIPALLALVFPMAELERSDRLQVIIVILIAVAAFDVGSYFVGRALGSRKLSPILSPNKTVEGLIGGIIATVIVALLAAALVDIFDLGTALAVALGVIVASPLGDLAESLMKRSLGIKDMGQLIPGHGGVLDRIDSYLFAVPIAYLVLRWTGLL